MRNQQVFGRMRLKRGKTRFNLLFEKLQKIVKNHPGRKAQRKEARQLRFNAPFGHDDSFDENRCDRCLTVR
ncbi:MAG: hypothetical protein C0507_12200 [Cyanobacteria bacterium PR.3.49]|nr:hypothetical protein [Cyanobacteria bacterium PR.3.49]